MPNSIESQLAGLIAGFAAHTKSDDERYATIMNNTTQILNNITDIGRKLDNSMTRVHDRIDEEAGKSRHAINNTNAVIHAEVERMERDQRVVAQDLIERITVLKVSALVSGSTVLLGLVSWLFAHYVLVKPV